MERVKKLEKQHGRIPRYMGSGMYEKCGFGTGETLPITKGKKESV